MIRMRSSIYTLTVLFGCLYLLVDPIAEARYTDRKRNEESESRSTTWPVYHENSNDLERRPSSHYLEHMKGCKKRYSEEECNRYDRERMAMNLNQPPSMMNYTSAGYAKVVAPASVFEMLHTFYKQNRGGEKAETWPRGNVYTNHWKAPTKMLKLGDPKLKGGNLNDRTVMMKAVQDALEAWTKMPLVPTSLYGIRIYKKGAVLAPHVDRMPLVISAIINVAQDTKEPWVLRLIGHDGIEKDIAMEPGDMVLYEGHSVVHGRPIPLNGTYFANVFFHFEPVGLTEQYLKSQESIQDTKSLWERTFERRQQKPMKHVHYPSDDEVPHYVNPGKESMWRQDYVFIKNWEGSDHRKHDRKVEKEKEQRPERAAHQAAAKGKLGALQGLVQQDKSFVDRKDHNGWQPIHEAARAGKTKIVEYLIEKGSPINDRTNMGKGGTPLWWAEQSLGEKHETTKLLKKHGAVSIGPKT